MKPIRFSKHAKSQMFLRGASEEDIVTAIRHGKWESAKLGKFQSNYRFDFNSMALTNKRFFKYKIVEPIFADEPDEIVVITTKVYYSNEKATK